MREVQRGHIYALDNLKGPGESTLQFYRCPLIHKEGHPGPSTQEVIRACIARVKSLHSEKPHPVNVEILQHLRIAITLFESRALQVAAHKGTEIESIPVNSLGHVWTEIGTDDTQEEA